MVSFKNGNNSEVPVNIESNNGFTTLPKERGEKVSCIPTKKKSKAFSGNFLRIFFPTLYIRMVFISGVDNINVYASFPSAKGENFEKFCVSIWTHYALRVKAVISEV